MPLANALDYPIWANGLIFVTAAAIIWIAGTRLVRLVDGIARKTGLGQAFAGMLLLGIINCLPEIANVSTASWAGNPTLAVNNLLGSAAINIVLLAVMDSVFGREALTSFVAKPTTLMQATLSILVLSVLVIAITVGDFPVLGIGAGSLTVFTASIGAFWLASHYEQRSTWTTTGRQGLSSETEEGVSQSTDVALSLFVGKTLAVAAVIFAAGYCLSQTGDALAEQTGLGSGLVGFVFMGIATSMPELSTITTALRMRKYEMAIGEVLGTNLVNLSLVLLADAVFVGGPVINEIGRFESVSALIGIVVTAILLIGLLERRNATFLRMGYDSLAIMVSFGLGLALLYFIG